MFTILVFLFTEATIWKRKRKKMVKYGAFFGHSEQKFNGPIVGDH
jgi:hypothetical protein